MKKLCENKIKISKFGYYKDTFYKAHTLQSQQFNNTNDNTNNNNNNFKRIILYSELPTGYNKCQEIDNGDGTFSVYRNHNDIEYAISTQISSSNCCNISSSSQMGSPITAPFHGS